MLVFLIVVWFVVAKKFPWYSESFPEDQVGRGCADVGLYCCADREECAGKAPEPLLGFVVCQGVKSFFETTVEAFHEAVGLRMVRGGKMRFYAPSVEELLPDG